jgi:hypothetical protein
MIVRALEELGYGKCRWRVRNEEIYENLFWLDTEIDKPTEEEIQAKIAELEAAEPLRLLRLERDRLIQQTDWRATVDYPNPDKQAWLDYRQALRDLPETAEPQLDENGQLTNVIWPTPPT